MLHASQFLCYISYEEIVVFQSTREELDTKKCHETQLKFWNTWISSYHQYIRSQLKS
jgi:hypothetical protein